MSLLERTNDALKTNPPTGDTFALTVGSSDWLWAVTAFYCFSFLIVVGLTYFARNGERIFHYLFTISLFVGAISYFAMASDLGSTPIVTSTNESGTREIFYVRYINWFVGWTPLITALGLISGVSWATIIYNIALSWVWVVSYLSAALVATHYKWGFFAFGTVSYFLLSVSLLHTGITSSKRLPAPISTHYLLITGWLVFIWMIYPIAFGVDDGGNKIGVAEGFIFVGILDCLTVPVLCVAVLVGAMKWDYRGMNLYFTQYGRVPPPAEGEFVDREKAVTSPETPVIGGEQV